MWIRLLLCTKDKTYRERLSDFLNRKYGDKVEVSKFGDLSQLLSSIKSKDADLILFGEELEKEAVSAMQEIPGTYAILMERLYTSEKSAPVSRIAKYQRGDELYREAISIYSRSEKIRQVRTTETGTDGTVYVFFSPGGGVGTTTIARAYAEKYAESEKVLYLDLSPLSVSLTGEEKERGMDDILVALKSRRDILKFKLESAVSENGKGIYTYAPCKDPRSLLDVTREDIGRLIEGIRQLGEYGKIILDVGDSLTWKEIELFKHSDQMICVVEEKETVREKYAKLCELFENLEDGKETRGDGQTGKIRFFRKMTVFRNKAVNNGQTDWGFRGIRVTGEAPKMVEDSMEAVIEQIRQSDAFDEMEIGDAEQL